jgi:hypothetical protein
VFFDRCGARCCGALVSVAGSTNEVAPFFNPWLPLVAGARFTDVVVVMTSLGLKLAVACDWLSRT